MATEFSLESVRQYMLAHEGRVTNHDLVKHYKAWLTHPTEKESARQRFKGRKISKAIYFALQSLKNKVILPNILGRSDVSNFENLFSFFQLRFPAENNKNKYLKFDTSKSINELLRTYRLEMYSIHTRR